MENGPTKGRVTRNQSTQDGYVDFPCSPQHLVHVDEQGEQIWSGIGLRHQHLTNRRRAWSSSKAFPNGPRVEKTKSPGPYILYTDPRLMVNWASSRHTRVTGQSFPRAKPLRIGISKRQESHEGPMRKIFGMELFIQRDDKSYFMR